MTHDNLEKYGPNFKLQLMNMLLHDNELLAECSEVLDPYHFSPHSWVVDRILWYFKNYRTCISREALASEWEKLKGHDKEELKIYLQKVYHTKVDAAKYVKDEALNFLRTQTVAQAVMESVNHIRSGDLDLMMDTITKAYKRTTNKDLGHNYVKDVELRFTELRRGTVLPTPWLEINDVLKGGLGSGELGVVFGNPGTGKSWAMTAIAAEALKLEKRVCFYTLEMTEAEVGRRFDSYFLGVDSRLLIEKKEELLRYIRGLKGNLQVKEYYPNVASVSFIRDHFLRCADEDGVKPDMIIIDYADYLRPSARRYENRKQEIDSIYLEVKSLAQELKIPIWTPGQANRTAAGQEKIEGHHVAGSYDKMMVADFCVSLTRTTADKNSNSGRLHVMKNRHGEDGKTFNFRCDLSCGKIEIVDENINVDPTSPDNSLDDVPF